MKQEIEGLKRIIEREYERKGSVYKKIFPYIVLDQVGVLDIYTHKPEWAGSMWHCSQGEWGYLLHCDNDTLNPEDTLFIWHDGILYHHSELKLTAPRTKRPIEHPTITITSVTVDNDTCKHCGEQSVGYWFGDIKIPSNDGVDCDIILDTLKREDPSGGSRYCPDCQRLLKI